MPKSGVESRKRGTIEKLFSVLVILSVGAYIFVLYYMLFRLFGRAMVITSEHMLDNFNYWNSVNLVPFRTIAEYVTAAIGGEMRGHAMRNLFGNLLLFFPAGFYLPYFARITSKIKIFSIVMAAAIIVVETVQLATKSGSLDVDDFILNFAGALIGCAVFTRTPVCALLKLRAW